MHSTIDATGCDSILRAPWYALYTKHQHEKSASRILTIRGFEIFLPLYQSVHRWRDRTKVVSVPLFPCYVFLNANLKQRRLDVVTTPGVFALVSNAGEPAAIPTDEIEAIRRAVEGGATVEPHPFLKCGERVRVKCGPMSGIQGILVRKKGVCRLVLSVEMLGKAVAVEIDSFLVEPLAGEHRVGYGVVHREARKPLETAATGS